MLTAISIEEIECLLVRLMKEFLDVVVVEDQRSFVEVSWFFFGYGRSVERSSGRMGSGFK